MGNSNINLEDGPVLDIPRLCRSPALLVTLIFRGRPCFSGDRQEVAEAPETDELELAYEELRDDMAE
jgi:hypothetical protein